jgi:hypothetical protein
LPGSRKRIFIGYLLATAAWVWGACFPYSITLYLWIQGEGGRPSVWGENLSLTMAGGRGIIKGNQSLGETA